MPQFLIIFSYFDCIFWTCSLQHFLGSYLVSFLNSKYCRIYLFLGSFIEDEMQTPSPLFHPNLSTFSFFKPAGSWAHATCLGSTPGPLMLLDWIVKQTGYRVSVVIVLFLLSEIFIKIGHFFAYVSEHRAFFGTINFFQAIFNYLKKNLLLSKFLFQSIGPLS